MRIFVVAWLCSVVSADLPSYDAARVERNRKRADDAFAKRDTETLRELLGPQSFYTRPRAAMYLGRLGVWEALPALRKLDRRLARFACWRQGEFGVAIVLIEAAGRNEQRAALLEVATACPKDGKWPPSVIDRAGLELARFGGRDVAKRLEGVRTYGAQYTVLSIRCAGRLHTVAIARCIRALEAHVSPMSAAAAQRLLIEFGKLAEPAIRALARRASLGARPLDGTIVRRCKRILAQIEADR